MSKIVSTDARFVLGTLAATSGDLSDWAKTVTINWGEETRDVTCMGDTQRLFRAGLGTASIEVTFVGDHASGGPNPELREFLSVTSTGVDVYACQKNTVVSTTNPMFYGAAVIDGDISQLAESIGEVPELTVRFVPYTAFSVQTSATS